MKNFEIRNIFSQERLRSLNGSESQATSSARRAAATSKESLKRSMNELLSEIVSSLSPETSPAAHDDVSERKILH